MTSRQIESNQSGIHSKLDAVVTKHLNTEFKKPIADYSQKIFDEVFNTINDFNGPLVFDSFCGVGESTVNLAKKLPDTLIVGLDKSAHRLHRHDEHYRQSGIDNYLLIRADVEDFWRQSLTAGWRLQQHFMLYPNPWPKSSQLQRRCHGSPLFPFVLQLGGVLEVRSNWRLYIEEFHQALVIAGHKAEFQSWPATTAITPFERKYQNSGQILWRLTCELD